MSIDLTWHASALCAQIDPDLFYPEAGYASEVQQAKAICGMCEVKQQCLDFAMAHREEHGVWGGTTPRERMNMRRRLRNGLPAVAAQDDGYINGSNWGRKGECKRGHPLTEDNIMVSKSGVRRCKTCKTAHDRARAKLVSERRRLARESLSA